MKNLYLVCLMMFSLAGYSQEFWAKKAGPLGGTVTDLEYYPGTDKIFAIVGGILYFSSDGGSHWNELGEDVHEDFTNVTFTDVEISGGKVYAITSSSMYVSADEGASFTEESESLFFGARKIKRLNNGYLVILATGTPDVYYSIDNGDNWVSGWSTGTVINPNQLAVNNLDQIFILQGSGTLARIYMSTDFGATFSIHPSAPAEATYSIASNPVFTTASNFFVYAVTATSIYRLDQTNGTWGAVKTGISDATLENSGTSSSSFIEFSADGSGMYFIDNFNATHKTYTKTISSTTWTATATFPTIPPNPEVYCASAKNYPAVSSHVVFGADGGVWKSTSGGGNLIHTSSGITEVASNGMLVATNGNLIVQTSTLGVLYSTDDGATWTRSATGPTGSVAQMVSATESGGSLYHFILTTGGVLYRSTNHGVTWSTITTPALFNTIDGATAKMFARAGNSVYYSFDTGGTWTEVTAITGFPAGSITDFHVASSSRIFIRVNNGGVQNLYRIQIGYVKLSPNTILSKTATLLTVPTTPVASIDNMAAKNGKFYVYDYATDLLEVSSDLGVTWPDRPTPNGGFDTFHVSDNGYIFIVEDFSFLSQKDKIHFSRDDGATFTPTELPLNTRGSSTRSIVTALNNYAYLNITSDAVYRTTALFVLPTAPSSLTALASNNAAAVIRWVDNSTTEEHYLVERSSNAGANYTTIGSVDNSAVCDPNGLAYTYFTDTTVVAGETYRYRVTAVNEAGSSAAATVNLAAIPAGCVSTFPLNRSWSTTNSGEDDIPAGATDVVGVKWVGENRFLVSDMAANTYNGTSEGSNVPGEFFVSCATATSTIVAGSNTLKSNGADAWNGTNQFKLKWRRCNTDQFQTITFNLQANDPAPAAPVLKGAIRDNVSIALEWTTGFFEKDYIIERATDAGFSNVTQINGSQVLFPTNTFIDNGPLTEGATYFYRIRSRNGNAAPLSSPNSNAVEITFNKPTFVVAPTILSQFNALTFGAFWADFDNDGDDDFMTTSGEFFNSSPVVVQIFRNLGNGNFSKNVVTLPAKSYQFGSVADFTNDGIPDLALLVSGLPQVDLFRGNGDLTFTQLSAAEMGQLATEVKADKQAISWTDFNNDGRLDILLTGEYSSLEQASALLFKQNPDGTFTRVTNSGDLMSTDDFTFFGYWADFDNDGDADVVISDTSGPWLLYRNNGDETFTLLSPGATQMDATNGYGGGWGDFNNDGYLDLFASVSTNDVVYRNNGNGTFTKETIAAMNINTGTVSPVFADFNNDGLLDIYCPRYTQTRASLYINTSSGSNMSFQRITNELVCDPNIAHLGTAVSDFDDNGFLDMGMAAIGLSAGFEASAAPTHLYKSNSSTGNYVKVKLVGVASNKSGVGAKVTVTAGLKTITREVTMQHSFISSNSTTLHFGLGAETSISSIHVRWPGNTTQTLSGPDINQTIVITQDTSPPLITAQTPAPNSTAPITTTVSLTFNEPVVSAPLKNFVLTGVGDPSPTATIPTASATPDGNKFTFTVPQLVPNKLYEVTIDAGGFQDIYGNAFAGIATNTWRFTTGASLVVQAYSPGHGNTGIGATAPIELTYVPTITAVAAKKIRIYYGTGLQFEDDVTSKGTVSGNKYSYPAPPEGWPLETVIKVTLDAGAFKDGVGNLSAAIADGEYSFTTVDAPDTQAPVITAPNATTVNQAELPAFFLAKIEDDTQVTGATLNVRKISGSATTAIQGTLNDPANNLWRFNVNAAEAFDATGTQFFITATDGVNIARSPATGFQTVLIKYPATGTQLPSSLIVGGGTVSSWRIIAVPFDLGASNGVQSVFEEFSTNNNLKNKVDYRILSYRETPTREFFDYLEGFSTIDRGKGYFINLKTAVPLRVGDDATAPNNTRANLFQMNLVQGWNMIGNPYLTPITWADVVTLNGLTGTATTLKTYTGSYVNTETLAPFEGGFVQMPAARTVSIPFQGQTAAGGRTQETFGDGEWLLPIVVQQGELKNLFGGIGMHMKADQSFDQFDDTNAPRFIEFVEMSFDHPEHYAKKFARDVVRLQDEYTWEFDVTTSTSISTELRWDNTLLLAGKDIFLYDVVQQVPVNMKEQPSYTFDPGKSHTFKVYYGDDAALRIKPSRVMLGAAYPNPTGGESVIPFTLPDAPGRMNVTLEVFDLMGRRVATIVNDALGAGFYHGVWRAGDDSVNGLYTYRLKVTGANEGVHSGKLILKK